MFYRVVAHDGLGRVAKHLGNIQVERLHAIALFEREVGIASGLTDYVQRGAFALSYLLYVLNMFLVNQQAHTLLTFVGNDFFARQRLVADRQFRHVYFTATLLNQFGETVQVTC